MSIKINKNGKEYDLGFMPLHYPADRVIMADGETNVEQAIENIYKYEKLLTSSDDLDTIFEVGNYRTYAANGKPLHAPSAASTSNSIIKVEYLKSDNMYVQSYEQYMSGVPYTFKRRYYSGSWGDWYRVSNIIKSKTMTVTTDGTNAVASTGLSTTNTIPLSVYCTGMTALIGSAYQNEWYVGLYSYGTGTPLKNTTKEITIYYIQN